MKIYGPRSVSGSSARMVSRPNGTTITKSKTRNHTPKRAKCGHTGKISGYANQAMDILKKLGLINGGAILKEQLLDGKRILVASSGGLKTDAQNYRLLIQQVLAALNRDFFIDTRGKITGIITLEEYIMETGERPKVKMRTGDKIRAEEMFTECLVLAYGRAKSNFCNMPNTALQIVDASKGERSPLVLPPKPININFEFSKARTALEQAESAATPELTLELKTKAQARLKEVHSLVESKTPNVTYLLVLYDEQLDLSAPGINVDQIEDKLLRLDGIIHQSTGLPVVVINKNILMQKAKDSVKGFPIAEITLELREVEIGEIMLPREFRGKSKEPKAESEPEKSSRANACIKVKVDKTKISANLLKKEPQALLDLVRNKIEEATGFPVEVMFGQASSVLVKAGDSNGKTKQDSGIAPSPKTDTRPISLFLSTKQYADELKATVIKEFSGFGINKDNITVGVVDNYVMVKLKEKVGLDNLETIAKFIDKLIQFRLLTLTSEKDGHEIISLARRPTEKVKAKATKQLHIKKIKEEKPKEPEKADPEPEENDEEIGDGSEKLDLLDQMEATDDARSMDRVEVMA